MKDFDKALQKRHQYKSYKSHFKSLYMLVGIAGTFLLIASAFFSAKFFAAWFVDFGEGAIIIGAVISVAIAVFISVLTEKNLVYYDAQGIIEPVMGIMLFALLAINVYGDFEGSAEWGAEIVGAPPVDRKTSTLSSTYQTQIDAIDEEIDAIEGKYFYWCGPHNTAHKCDLPTNKPYINRSDPKDIKAEADIAALAAQRSELRDTMNSLLEQASGEHAAALNAHGNKLKKTKGRMRGASVVCMVLYLMLMLWRHGYGKRAVKEISSPTPKPSPSPTSKPSAQDIQHMYEAEKEALQKQLEEQAREFDLLREELQATKEAEQAREDGEARGK